MEDIFWLLDFALTLTSNQLNSLNREHIEAVIRQKRTTDFDFQSTLLSTIPMMSYQLTVLKSNDSFIEAFFVSNALYQELLRISQVFELEYLNLAFLHEVKTRAIAFCSRRIRTAEPIVVSAFASVALDWFDELLALIEAVSVLPSSDSLSIRFD